MSERLLTPEEKEQFISAIQSGEIVLMPIIEEAPKDIVYEPIEIVFQPMQDDDTPYFE